MAPWHDDEPTFPTGRRLIATLHLDDLDDAELADLDLPVTHPASPLALGSDLHMLPARQLDTQAMEVTMPSELDAMLIGYLLDAEPPPAQDAAPMPADDLEREATSPERPRRR